MTVKSKGARASAAATDGVVAEVAQRVLLRGNAVDAVVAGVFAASARTASVLLGPVQILVGGAGVGLHAIDGRAQQPGRGLARPRGFVSDETVPLAARVGAPALPAALAAALASFGKTPLAQVVAPAIEIARATSKPRAELLQRIAEGGPRALARARVAGELMLAAGRGAGGLLSQRDLEDLRPRVVEARAVPIGSGRIVAVPWGADAVRDPESQGVSAGATRVVVAIDARGAIAVACYEAPGEGLSVDALDLVAPAFATPVRRGQTRVPPGEPCITAAPIALRERDGQPEVGAGASEDRDAEKSLGRWLRAYDDEPHSQFMPVPPPAGLLAIARLGRETRVVGRAEGETG